jgi:hypothetical protein
VGIDSKIGNFSVFQPFTNEPSLLQRRRRHLLLEEWGNVQASGSCFKSFAITDAALIASYALASGSVLWQAFCEFWIVSGAGAGTGSEQASANEALSVYLEQDLVTSARYSSWVKASVVSSSSAWRNVSISAPVEVVACEFEKKSLGGVCVCKWGYSKGSDGKCVACAKDHYKATISDKDACTKCPPGSQAGAGQRVCGCNDADFEMDESVMR